MPQALKSTTANNPIDEKNTISFPMSFPSLNLL